MPNTQQLRRISREPLWQPEARYNAGVLPQRNRYWLLDDGSLTSRLIAISKGPFRVERLSQSWQVPLPSERDLLGIPQRQLALIREVALMDGEQAVVFARSVFPLACLTGNLCHLKRLQNKPLGAILFRNPGMHRSPFELAHITGVDNYIPQQLAQPESAWGRRSRFTLEGASLMVSEVFLKPFSPWPNSAPIHRTQRGKVSAANLHIKQ